MTAAGRVSRTLADELARKGVGAMFPARRGQPLLGHSAGEDEGSQLVPHIFYVDDGSIPVTSPAGGLADAVVITVECNADVFHRYGFALRAGRNKTAVVFQ